MHMIRHNNEFVQFHIGEMNRDFMPTFFNVLPLIVQPHFPVHNIAEQTNPVLRANSDEIGPLLRIIISLQPNRSAMASIIGPISLSAQVSSGCGGTFTFASTIRENRTMRTIHLHPLQ